MIVRAALCPSPPLLARGLTGRAEILPDLRDACAAAAAHLLAADPDVVAVVGGGQETATWDPEDQLDLSAYAAGYAPSPASALAAGLSGADVSGADVSGADVSAADVSAAGSHGKPVLPLAVGIGALLLDEAGYAGPRILQAVDESAPADACLRLGRDLAGASPRVALLAVGDGSARRGRAAPGYLDERAVPFDDAVHRAVREGDMAALADLDPDLARDLMATGRAAWQVLAGAYAGAYAGAFDGTRPAAEIRYAADPFGVAYLVALLS